MYFVPFLEFPYMAQPAMCPPYFQSNPYLPGFVYPPASFYQPPINLSPQPSQFSESCWANKVGQCQNACKHSTKIEQSNEIHRNNQDDFEEQQRLEDQEPEDLSQEASFTGKTSSKKKRGHKIHRKYNQNAERNVLTNIGNQMITFLGNRKRSENAYIHINPKATNEEITQFYEFIHKLRRRKRIPIYINQKKLLEMWYPKTQMVSHASNYSTLRRLSLIFLQETLPLFLINSTRIKKETKILHIAAARKMLQLLRYHRDD